MQILFWGRLGALSRLPVSLVTSHKSRPPFLACLCRQRARPDAPAGRSEGSHQHLPYLLQMRRPFLKKGPWRLEEFYNCAPKCNQTKQDCLRSPSTMYRRGAAEDIIYLPAIIARRCCDHAAFSFSSVISNFPLIHSSTN